MTLSDKNGQKLAFHQLDMVEDIQRLYCEYHVFCNQVLSEKCKIDNNILYPVSSSFQDGIFKNVCINETTLEALNASYESFCGRKNLVQVLQMLGVRNTIKTTLNNSFWIFRKGRLRNIIETINKYVNVNNGGAPFAYLDKNGCLDIVDLVLSQKRKPKKISGEVLSYSCDRSYIGTIGSNVNIITYEPNKTSSELIKSDKSMGTDNCTCFDSTGYYSENIKQQLSNNYSKISNSSARIVFSMIGNDFPSIGDRLILNEKYDVVLGGVITSLSNNEQFQKKLIGLCQN